MNVKNCKFTTMKKAVLFLTAALLVGCTCIGQIPDQMIYLDSTCQAELPDYRDAVTVQDNCEGVVLLQEPDPGSILDAGNPFMDVVITATDISGNQDRVEFRVIALDTIPPVITLDESLMSYSVDIVGDLMEAAHYYTAHSIQQAVDRRPDSALVKYPQLASWDTIWEDYAQVTFYPRAGDGTYLSTWYTPGQYLCSCDSTTYYQELAAGTVINLQFDN